MSLYDIMSYSYTTLCRTTITTLCRKYVIYDIMSYEYTTICRIIRHSVVYTVKEVGETIWN